MDLSDELLRRRVSDGLQRRAGEYRNLKQFYFDIAELAESSESSAKNWTRGECLPGATELLRLFIGLDGFEKEVRGDTLPPDHPINRPSLDKVHDAIAAALAEVRHLKAQPSLAAVPVEGKVSSRGIRSGEKPEDGAA